MRKIIGLLWDFFSVYQIIIENGVYVMVNGTFNVTINEHMCKYNVTKSATQKRPIYTVVIHI